ncbi:MAG: aminotransferase class V-fold PLP-dependent enzyme, partial [Actinomycetota bacterium]
GVSYAPHGLPNVQALDCDVYLYSTYKTYGPHVGLMYTRRSVLEQMTNQGHYFKDATPGGWLTPAGPDHAAIGSVAGIVDYYDTLVDHHGIAGATRRDRIATLFDAFAAHEEAVTAPLVELLIGHDRVRLVGAQTAAHAVRAPTIAFHVPGTTSRSIYDALIAAQVSCGHGNFYAQRLVHSLGLDVDDGVVRISAVHYNTDDDIARACAVLDDVL